MKIDFIESKIINFKDLKKLYKFSEKENRHSNFGPISKKLEKKISNMLSLADNKKVIMCSSATSAILLAANYIKQKFNVSRFVTSNIAFFSNNINFLNNIRIIDTNSFGCIDVNILEKFKHTFDCYIHTNYFNYNYDFSDIYKFCKKNKKKLIIDNAVNLTYRPDNYNDMNVFDVVSFHHTKLLGFGEGGCLILPKNHYLNVLNLSNFGAKNFKKNKKYSLNAKISDLSCSAILLRLKKRKLIIKRYQYQKQRLLKLITNTLEYSKILLNKNDIATTAIPILLKKKIDLHHLRKLQYLTVLKYYRPLSRSYKYKNSIRFYDHIINIPCNPDINRLNDNQIKKDLILINKYSY